MKKTQRERILADLLQGLHVDMLKDIERYGTSCRSRIAELRADGYPIQDYFNKSNSGRFKTYYLSKSFLAEYHRESECIMKTLMKLTDNHPRVKAFIVNIAIKMRGM